MSIDRARAWIAGGLCVAGALVALAACGSHDAVEGPAAAGTSWDAMTKDQHIEIMRKQVLPTMRNAFGAFDPVKFKVMNCVTCHGDGAKDKSFTMPNPKLPPLPADAEGFAALAKEKPAIVTFMKETVVPEVARMIGEAPYDPATHEGFGCFECHTKKP